MFLSLAGRRTYHVLPKAITSAVRPRGYSPRSMRCSAQSEILPARVGGRVGEDCFDIAAQRAKVERADHRLAGPTPAGVIDRRSIPMPSSAIASSGRPPISPQTPSVTSPDTIFTTCAR